MEKCDTFDEISRKQLALNQGLHDERIELNETGVRIAFLQFFVDLMQDYREYIKLTNKIGLIVEFDIKGFFKSLDKEDQNFLRAKNNDCNSMLTKISNKITNQIEVLPSALCLAGRPRSARSDPVPEHRNSHPRRRHVDDWI